MSLTFPITVYYEDTDAGGIVYYANYLKYVERARTEWLKKIGLSNTYLAENHNIYFVVKSCSLDFKKPAVLEDELLVYTSVQKIGSASIDLIQTIQKKEQVLVSVNIRIATVGKDKKPVRIPPDVKEKMVL